MSKKHKQSTDATQLNLFIEEKNAPPPRRSQTFERREMSLAEITEKCEQFFAWGKRHEFPGFKFLHAKAVFQTKEIEYSQSPGAQAWRQTLLCKPTDWIADCLAWLEAGQFGDAYFLKSIHEGRMEMLLEYAWKRGYPELHGQIDGQPYSIAPGKEAWQKAARNVDRDVLEDAITKLALIEGDAHGQA